MDDTNYIEHLEDLSSYCYSERPKFSTKLLVLSNIATDNLADYLSQLLYDDKTEILTRREVDCGKVENYNKGKHLNVLDNDKKENGFEQNGEPSQPNGFPLLNNTYENRKYLNISTKSQRPNLSTRSLVLYTSTSDCFMNFFSPDQIGQFNLSANAKYGTSLLCGEISFALENFSEKDFAEMRSIRIFSNSMNKLNSVSENPESILNLCTFFSLSSSSNNLAGAYNFTLSENNISSFFVCIPLPLAIIAENSSLASGINSIILTPFHYNSGNSFFRSSYISSSISDAKAFASSSVNLDLADKASNTVLCNSFDLDRCISNAFAMIISLASFDNSEYDFSISSFNSDGTSNLITISSIKNSRNTIYLNVSDSNVNEKCYIEEFDNDLIILKEGDCGGIKFDVGRDYENFSIDYNYSNNEHVNLLNGNKKRKEMWQNRLMLPSLETINNETSKYINFSFYNNDSVGNAPVAESVNALVSKTSVLLDPRVRNSVLSESLGRGAYTSLSESSNEKCYIEEWKLFKELTNEDEVMTLNATSGEKAWQKPMERQEFEHNDDMYKIILEDGSDLVVSPEHRVYVRIIADTLEDSLSSERDKMRDTSNLSSYNFIKLPSKSSGFVLSSNLDNEFSNEFGFLCGILNQTTENIFSLGNKLGLLKCLSFVNNTLSSDLEIDANLPFENPFGAVIELYPLDLKNCNNSLSRVFSSIRNFGLSFWKSDDDILATSCDGSRIMKGCFDMFFSQGREGFQYFFNRSSIFEHFQDLPDHDSCSFESGCSTTNLTICNNIIINFNSHNVNDKDKVYKDFGLMPVKDVYSLVKEGKEVWFMDSDNNPVRVLNISKEDYSGKIYDVDVGNDIVLVRRGENSRAFWSGNSNNGTLVNGAKINRTGYFGNGSWFDGDNDNIDLGDTGELLNETFTMAAWINIKNTVVTYYSAVVVQSYMQYSTALQTMNGTGLFIGPVSSNNSGIAIYGTGNQSLRAQSGTNSIKFNQWYFIAGTKNTTSLCLYLNSSLQQCQNITFAFRPNTEGTLMIGNNPRVSANLHDFNGAIDEVMIFNRSLSADEIKALYNATANKYYNNFTGLAAKDHTFKAYSVDKVGNLNNSEQRTVASVRNPSGNRFRIVNRTDDNVASIDDKGDMYLLGTAAQSQSSLSPPPNSFILQNVSSDIISYINNTGYLFLRGIITESSDMTGATRTNFEFRNASSDLVAFFDNIGNLKLRGLLGESFGNP